MFRKKGMTILVILVISLCLLSIQTYAFASDNYGITIAAGGVGGTWFVAGAAFNEVWKENITNLTSDLLPGGGSTNPIRVDRRDVDVGFTYLTEARAASEGLNPYTEKLGNIRALANISVLQYFSFIMTKEDAPIPPTIRAVKENELVLHVSPGPPGMGGENTFKRVIEEYGFSYKDITDWGGSIHYSNWTDTVNLIRDGHLNTIVTDTAKDSPTQMETCSARDVIWLCLEDEIAQNLEDKYGYMKTNWPETKLHEIPENCTTVANGVVLIVNKDVPDDLVYQLTKVLCENGETWKRTHSMFADFDPANGPKVPIELHPGAAKYYKEQGYME